MAKNIVQYLHFRILKFPLVVVSCCFFFGVPGLRFPCGKRTRRETLTSWPWSPEPLWMLGSRWSIPSMYGKCSSSVYLVGCDWNMTFILSYIGKFIIPIYELIFFRGIGTTNQIKLCVSMCGPYLLQLSDLCGKWGYPHTQTQTQTLTHNI